MGQTFFKEARIYQRSRESPRDQNSSPGLKGVKIMSYRLLNGCSAETDPHNGIAGDAEVRRLKPRICQD